MNHIWLAEGYDQENEREWVGAYASLERAKQAFPDDLDAFGWGEEEDDFYHAMSEDKTRDYYIRKLKIRD